MCLRLYVCVWSGEMDRDCVSEGKEGERDRERAQRDAEAAQPDAHNHTLTLTSIIPKIYCIYIKYIVYISPPPDTHTRARAHTHTHTLTDALYAHAHTHVYCVLCAGGAIIAGIVAVVITILVRLRRG